MTVSLRAGTVLLAATLVPGAGSAVSAPVHARDLGPQSGRPPATVQAAEAEGAAFPAGQQAAAQPGFNPEGAVGSADRKCVDTRNNAVAVSGDFTAGPFAMFERSWHEGRTKMWWSPRYASDWSRWEWGDAGLLLRSTQLGPAGGTATYRSGSMVRSIPAGVRFFNTGFWLPSAGQWLVVATFEHNWGCFLVTTTDSSNEPGSVEQTLLIVPPDRR